MFPQLCNASRNEQCLFADGTSLNDGNKCSDSGGGVPFRTIVIAVVVVFFVLIVGGLCTLNICHHKRKKKPLVPLFSSATLSKVRLPPWAAVLMRTAMARGDCVQREVSSCSRPDRGCLCLRLGLATRTICVRQRRPK